VRESTSSVPRVGEKKLALDDELWGEKGAKRGSTESRCLLLRETKKKEEEKRVRPIFRKKRGEKDCRCIYFLGNEYGKKRKSSIGQFLFEYKEKHKKEDGGPLSCPRCGKEQKPSSTRN